MCTPLASAVASSSLEPLPDLQTPLIVAAISAGLLLAIWLGYPLVIRLVGQLRQASSASNAAPQSVSVVLATREEASAVCTRIADLLRTTFPHSILEIIVARDVTRADSGRFDFTGLGDGAPIRVVDGDAPGGKSATLNAGVRAARHDVLVFADTAQSFDTDVIPVLVAALQEPGFGAVSGMLEIPHREDGSLTLAERYWRFERWLRQWEARVHSCVGVTGAIYAMPRRLWEPLPANLILDDVYIPMRLAMHGWRVGFAPFARATDVRRFAPAQEYRRKVRTLTGVIQVCAWLPGVLNPLRNPIWLQFVCHKLLRLVTPYLAGLTFLAIAWWTIWKLLSLRGGAQFLLVSAVMLVALCLLPRVRRGVVGRLERGLALQASVVVATINGLRGRWDVWR